MADKAGAPPRAWQRMLSGRRLDLLDPSPLDIEIADIAHGLARVARWNGQTVGDHAFTVAQHSLLVEEIFCAVMPQASPMQRLAALLHDAPEYVIGDMISPFKSVVGGGYKEVEGRLQRAIHLRFALPAELPATCATRSSAPTRSPPISRRRCWPGFRSPRRSRYFGRPRGFDAIALRPCAAGAEQGAEVVPVAVCRDRESALSAAARLPPRPVQPLQEPLRQPDPDLVLLAGILPAMVEVGVVVDLDDEDAVLGLLEVDAVEAVADAARRTHRGVDDMRRRLLQREGLDAALVGLAVALCLTICQCFLAIR